MPRPSLCQAKGCGATTSVLVAVSVQRGWDSRRSLLALLQHARPCCSLRHWQTLTHGQFYCRR